VTIVKPEDGEEEHQLNLGDYLWLEEIEEIDEITDLMS
jgi:hypothetical protein